MRADDEIQVDDLIDRALQAVNRGDLTTAHDLAEQVLAADAGNVDASSLLATELLPTGEVRRLTIMFCDLVGSTELSGRLDPESYRAILALYRRRCTEVIESDHGGHVARVKGDGILGVFGYPEVHDNDTERAVRAGLDIVSAVAELSAVTERDLNEPVSVRCAVHRGVLYIDPDEDDVYGLAANVAARLQELATPGSVVISDVVTAMVGGRFELEAGEPAAVKGVAEPIQPFRVVEPRAVGGGGATRPLVGRSAELTRLREAWLGAKSEANSANTIGIGVRGEPGIGKSRLVEALASEVRGDRGVALELRASPMHTAVGYHPLRALLEQRLGVLPEDDAPRRLMRLAGELDDLGFLASDTVPLLAPILGLRPQAGYEGAAREARKLSEEIAKATSQYVLAAFGDGPALLVVEDYQWLDDPSRRELVAEILRSGRGQTLVIVTSRGDLPGRLEAVELGPLPHDARIALIETLAPGSHDAAMRNGLATRSDGIPLYLEELVRGVGLPSAAAPVARNDTSAVPDALYEPLVARLYATPSGVAVAGAAATIGRDVDHQLLAAAVDVAEPDLRTVVDAFLATRIFERLDGTQERYRFRHELLREVAYELQPPSRRRELHGRVGDLLVGGLTADEVADWCVVADHFERADRDTDAIEAYQHAAEDARRRGSLAEARLHLGRAVELVASLPQTDARDLREVGIRLRRAFLTMSAEGASSPAASSDYERCLELAMHHPHSREMVSSLTSMWAYYLSRADLAPARDVSRALTTAVASGPQYLRTQNIASFGMIDWFEGRFAEADEELRVAESELVGQHLYDEIAHEWFVPTDPAAAIHIHFALARFVRGDIEGAWRQHDLAIQHARALEFPQGPWTECYSLWLGAWMACEIGAFERVEDDLRRMAELVDDHGLDSWMVIQMTAQSALTAVRAASGGSSHNTVMAQAGLVALVDAWEMVGLRCLLTYYITLIGRLVAGSGDPAGARERYDQALALAAATGQRFYDAETLRLRAHLETEPARLQAGLEEALEVARAQGAPLFQLRIALDLRDMHGDRATPALREAVSAFAPEVTFPELDEGRARLSNELA